MIHFKVAGLIYGPSEHHLDHVGVLCSLLKIPLLTTDQIIVQLACLYYPQLEVIYLDPFEAPFKIVQNYDCLISSIPRSLFDQIFFSAESLLKKKIFTIWMPHGYSDKSYLLHFMYLLQQEKALLIQGPSMKKDINTKGQTHALPPYLELGNYRLLYYLKNQSFYNSHFDSYRGGSEKVVLYAPTWGSYHNISSFDEGIWPMLENISQEYVLLIKLHPNLFDAPFTQKLLLEYDQHPRIKFLLHLTPIYPLLQVADIYLGDLSSIGYDFLFFNKPMFFFPTPAVSANLPLYSCGEIIDLQKDKEICKILKKNQSHLTSQRKALYDATFGKEVSLDLLKTKIKNFLTRASAQVYSQQHLTK